MTPEAMKQQAMLQAMALRGQEPQAQTRDADTFSAVGGALAGLGGRVGQAMSQDMSQRGDALRQLVGQQTLATQREAGDFARQMSQQGAQKDLADINNAAEMERLKLQLGAKAEEEKGKRAGQISESENKYRQQLFALQPVKDAMNMAAAYQGIHQALGQNSAAGDMAGVFQFMKVLDPTSSVREGEYANAKNSAGVPDQIVNLYNQSLSGKLLNPKQRQDFLGTAKGKYATQLREAKKYSDAFGGLATQDGGDAARVAAGLDFSSLDAPEAPELPRPTEAEYQKLPSGTAYIGKDGKPYKKK